MSAWDDFWKGFWGTLSGEGSDPADERQIYRTLDGQVDYRFHFVRQPSGIYHIFIVDQPSYNGRPEDGHATHRYWDGNRSQHYVCVERGLEPRTLQHARNWAREWAESTERYRHFGTRF